MNLPDFVTIIFMVAIADKTIASWQAAIRSRCRPIYRLSKPSRRLVLKIGFMIINNPDCVCLTTNSFYNIDWLDLSHEHDLLSGLIVESPARSDGISVILNRFFGSFGLHNYWYDLEMVEEV